MSSSMKKRTIQQASRKKSSFTPRAVRRLKKIQETSSPKPSQEIMSSELESTALSGNENELSQEHSKEEGKQRENENTSPSPKKAEGIKRISTKKIFKKIQEDFTLMNPDIDLEIGPDEEKVEGGYWTTGMLRQFALLFSRSENVLQEVKDYMQNRLLSHFSESEVKYIYRHAIHYYKIENEDNEPGDKWKTDLKKRINSYSQSDLNDRIKRISKETIERLKYARNSSRNTKYSSLLIHKNIVTNCKEILLNCTYASNKIITTIKDKKEEK